MNISINPPGKFSFLFNSVSTRINLFKLLFFIISPTTWLIFKYFYPYPFITIDSCVYVLNAQKNSNVSYWPIGYSKYIGMIGEISHSSLIFVTSQYIIVSFCLLLFFITICKILKPTVFTAGILFCFLFVNPLFIYGCNHVMSDALFMGVSYLWLSQLLQLLVRPRLYLIFTQALLILICFTLRYTALYYPLITIIVFIFSPWNDWKKIIGVSTTFLFLYAFIHFTCSNIERLSHVSLFSPSSGWKQANNALYMYDHIAGIDNKPIPEGFKELHQITKAYFNSPHQKVDFLTPEKDLYSGCFYMFSPESPLIIFTEEKTGRFISPYNLANSPLFSSYFESYAIYLISSYPLSYLQYVVWPNSISYFAPIPEIYGDHPDIHSLWETSNGKIVKDWFKTEHLRNPLKSIYYRNKLLSIFPRFIVVLHVLFLCSLILLTPFLIFKKTSSDIRLVLNTIITICICNFIFYILLSPSVLRFQFNIMVLELIVVLYLLEFITKRRFINK